MPVAPALRGRGAVSDHPDLDAALAAAGLAERFMALPPSHQREYTVWITEAKKPDTRARRIAGTIERLGKGPA